MNLQTSCRSLLVGLLVLLLGFGCGLEVLASPSAPAAGSILVNQASVTYVDPSSGRTLTVLSNAVQISVLPLEALSLMQDHTVTCPPGASVVLSHQLTNTGNVQSNYSFAVQNLGGDDYELAGLALYQDLNFNGVVDPDESNLLAKGALTLGPGSCAALLVVGTVPGGVSPGKSARVSIQATTLAQGAQAANLDTVIVADGAALGLLKSSNVLSASPGDEVEYLLTLSNIGVGSAPGVSILLDGTPQKKLLLHDSIPANTVFLWATGSGGAGQVVYHARGDLPTAWRSVPPADVDGVGYALDSLAPGGVALLRFRVRLNSNAAGLICNTGLVAWEGPDGPVEQPSNQVQVSVTGIVPSINYYFDGTWRNITGLTSLGNVLWVQADVASCNRDPLVVETIQISLSSSLTGDTEVFTATETGPNTGVFQILPAVPTREAVEGPIPGDGALQTVRNDTIIATELCSGFSATADILVDPYGVVFDSRTNALISGATVTLIDVSGLGNGGHPGGPATVFLDDGVTPAPSVLVTGGDGAFRFPLVPPSTYRLDILPPAGYGFPSVVPPGQLPPGRTIDVSGSYGGSILVNASLNPIRIDIPLDPPPPSGLFLEKTVNRQVVELGEFLEYTVRVSNGTGTDFSSVSVTDELPVGFSYVSGTTRVNDSPVPDPTGGAGPRLEFNLGPLADGSKATLVYRVRAGPGAGSGDRYNRAQAAGVSPTGTLLSNVGTVKVRVEPGVFTDRGILFGKVFVDRNGNGTPDVDEPGIPGVRLVLQDGTWVVTDSAGKYSLYGLRARTHVIRVDRSTLPPGCRLGLVSQRQGGDPYSRFVDLKSGELHRADFVEVSATSEVLAAVDSRRHGIDASEGERLLEHRMRPDAVLHLPADARSLPSTGQIGPAGPIPGEATPPRGELLDSRNSNLPDPPLAAEPAHPPVDAGIADLTNETGFVDLEDGVTLATPHANVRVKGLLGTTLRLSLNGQVLGMERVGTQSRLESRQLQVWEYVSVNFRPGENELLLEQVDGFGNARESVTISVRAPGAAGSLRLSVPDGSAEADGRTPVQVAVEVFDDQGLSVTARTPVTLEAEAGVWDVPDLDPRQPGVQVFVSGGRAEFGLLPPLEPGVVRLRASSGRMEARAEVQFTTEKRPLFAVGLVEARVDLRTARTGPVGPPEFDNLLEDEFERLARNDGSGTRADARADFYVKGHLGGGYVITSAYDSQKERDLRLFRDIQPDEYYPIYGDGSVKGFDAQSTSPFYLRLDNDRNSLLYGDFVTATPARRQSLGTYYRSLTGGRLHLEGDRHQVNVFGTRASQRQVVQEIPANGTSGPYLLNFRFPKVNSERVEIIVRDRSQPSVVLQSTGVSRYSDYVVDFQTGGILFRRPVASMDSNLNPVYVRVIYEVDGGGPRSWVYGGDANFRLTDLLSVGGTFAREDDPQDPFSLWSANLGLDFSESTRFSAEVAGTDRFSRGAGSGNYFELVHEGNPVSARLYTGRTDPAFDNPTSILASGRTESGLKASWQFDGETRFWGEAIRTRDNLNGGGLTGCILGVERRLGEGLALQLAWRRALQDEDSGRPNAYGVSGVDLSTVRARLNAQVPGTPEVTLFAEYEQDIRDSSKQALALGGEYQYSDRGRIYAHHELISTLGSRYELNQVERRNATVVGVDTDYMEGGHLFSEYRIRDAITGREAEAALGLRNTFQVADGLRLNASYERVMGGESSGFNNQSLTGALEYTGSPDLKGTARMEFRNSAGTTYVLRTLGLAWRATPDLSLLLRDVGDSSVAADGGGKRCFDRTQLGVAWRPADGGPFNALMKLERRFEQDDLAGRLRRNVGLLSLTGNLQVSRDLSLSAWYAGKLAREHSCGGTSEALAHLLGGRLLWQLGDKWDFGVHGARFFGAENGGGKHTFGVELGYMLLEGTWVSLGYNFTGFEDRDLSLDNYTVQGPYLRLRLKFGMDDFEEATP